MQRSSQGLHIAYCIKQIEGSPASGWRFDLACGEGVGGPGGWKGLGKLLEN